MLAEQFDAFVWFEETKAVTPLPAGHGMGCRRPTRSACEARTVASERAEYVWGPSGRGGATPRMAMTELIVVTYASGDAAEEGRGRLDDIPGLHS